MGIIQASRGHYRIPANPLSAIIYYSLRIGFSLQAFISGSDIFINPKFWWHFCLFNPYIFPQERPKRV